MSDAQMADSISIGESWLRVTAVKGQVEVMASQAVQLVSRLEEIKTRDLCVRMGNLKYEHGALVKNIGTMSDAQMADSIFIGESWLRVTAVKGQVEVMASQAVQLVSRLEEIKTRVQQVESRVDAHPSGHMAMQGHDVIVRLSQ
nr:hypothetical protein [Tanacetum cinerariifolium]